ncbi:class II aldolase/adducin family protein [Trueperella abortisuis]|uniref:Ribulose-5-phosphate 4-epimerase/fuculose-1-phosphate aldolase n=1 Tax=Trueperella abortisuis TaxID=445930 RepID=A0ABT9PHH3_9ACTO|nr:class II aldolase/adducin family protein [Trueperella abortisuis]MDP9831600.1 ribulose-5-phosphate 4-epimerase/fuculose-1-phosphate aldolase [Trueperella abortisuis]
MLESLVRAARQLSDLGLSPGTTGNLSARVDDTMWVSASGTSFSSIVPADFIPFRDGIWAEGRPTKEAMLHLEMYRKNPDAQVVIHLHSPEAAAASCLPAWRSECAFPPLSPYFVMKVGNMPMISYQPPGSSDLAQEIRELTTNCDCVLLQNHGQIVSAANVQLAVERCIEIENSARLRLLLEGKECRFLTQNEAEYLARQSKRPWLENDWRMSSANG